MYVYIYIYIYNSSTPVKKTKRDVGPSGVDPVSEEVRLKRGGGVLLTEILSPRIARQGHVCLISTR